jgi:Flp pilus assembly protein TadD
MDADPGFTASYIDQAQMLAGTGDRERATQLIQTAQRTRLDPIERANLEYVGATTSGNATDRLKALESLTQVTPANANLCSELGEMRFARREFEQAAREYRAAARLNPDEPRTWNELGYALARSKDLNGAREALAQYQKLAPEDANALDSQGEVSFFLGDFKAAGEYFERASAKNPAELLKAAEARLMMGDLRGADALFLKHQGPAAGPGGSAEYQMAQWEYLTGRPQAGMARMEKLASKLNGDLQALALSQLAIWKLDSGENEAAVELANEARGRAQSPQVRGVSAMCRSIASGSAGSGSKLADALALLFANKLREALPLLQAVYGATNPSADGQVRTLLAWAYVETGATEKAAPLVDIYPLPLSSGDPLFASLVLRNYWFARGSVLRQAGKRDEASKSFELYRLFRGRDQL